jgi:hypothetical protein
MKKKIKSILMRSDLIIWLENHARNYFAIESNFSALCNRILLDYAKAHGFKHNKLEENKEGKTE